MNQLVISDVSTHDLLVLLLHGPWLVSQVIIGRTCSKLSCTSQCEVRMRKREDQDPNVSFKGTSPRPGDFSLGPNTSILSYFFHFYLGVYMWCVHVYINVFMYVGIHVYSIL